RWDHGDAAHVGGAAGAAVAATRLTGGIGAAIDEVAVAARSDESDETKGTQTRERQTDLHGTKHTTAAAGVSWHPGAGCREPPVTPGSISEAACCPRARTP